MKQIRNNVFETNSSSVHTISIPKKSIDISDVDKIKQYVPSYIAVGGYGFGWEEDDYGDFVSLANYLFINMVDDSNCSDVKPNNLDHVDKFEKRCNFVKTTLAKYGIDIDFKYDLNSWDDYNTIYIHCDGYIDHGFENYGFVNHVLASEENLLTYLLKGYIVTGNDNCDYSKDMWDHINGNDIDKDEFDVFGH